MPTGPNLLPAGTDSTVRPMFQSLRIAASGLSAQRVRMETIATNIANAETTHTDTGGPYHRRVAQLDVANPAPFVDALSAANAAPLTLPGAPLGPIPVSAAGVPSGVQVTGIVEDPSEGPLVYDPSHPDANADGYVRYPNVSLTDETVDLMDARRMYEANATVFQVTKTMLHHAIDI